MSTAEPAAPPPATSSRWHWVAGAVTLIVFGLAIWVLARELSAISLRNLLDRVNELSSSALAWSFGLTVASYLVLTLYDVLALRHIGKRVPYPHVAFASFVGYSFSQNVGLGFVTGGSVRFRIYSGAGLLANEIAEVVAYCTFVFTFGIIVAIGVTLVLDPKDARLLLGLPPGVLVAMGVFILGTAVAYLAWTAFRPGPLKLFSLILRVPGFWTNLAGIGLALIDLTLAASVLYVLLPPDVVVSFPLFLGAYCLAIAASVLSHVPGGIGVFEAVMIVSIPGVPVDALVSAIIIYRIVYLILPLAFAALLMAGYEVGRLFNNGRP